MLMLAVSRRDGARVAVYLLWIGRGGGSDDAELLFLLGPGQRKVSREPGDGQVSRRAAFGDGLNDARRQIGERRQEPNVAFGQLFPFGERTEVNWGR